ncbi:MAG: hypothetical protein IH946_05425, partial [Bacteroidetes bacterium]|nr:hypothetical protein [Bacteroidota bacterium]
MRWLSPSILDALKDNKVPIVVRLSDFTYLCPEGHFLRNGKVCELCLHGSHWNSVKYKCIQGSFPASLLNALAISYHNYKGLLDNVDAFVCPSPFTMGKMIEGGFPEEKMHHIPTFIEGTKFEPQFEAGDYVLFFGRISNEKGARILLEGFLELIKDPKHKDRKLIFAGRSNDN